jgi:hypothetical protein
MRRLVLLGLVCGAAALPAAAGGAAQATPLTASVGPGFNILLADASGNRVTHLDPGAYAITVQDRSDLHNFHLNGPGVEKFTQIETTGDETWDVTLSNGTYNYQCDAHPSTMSGSFTVGAASPPPPPPPPPPPARKKLNAKVGPGAVITLKAASGRIVAGPVAITVVDVSAKDNFHLTGPGVNRKTGVAGKTTVVWKVTLVAGKTYTYRSDAHAGLKKTFVPRSA